jgi:hypothetical protein
LSVDATRVLEYPADGNIRWHFNKPAHMIDWIQPEGEQVHGERITCNYQHARRVDEPFGSLKEDTWSPYSPPRAGLVMARQRLQGALLEHDPNLYQHDWSVVFLSREVGHSVRSISNEQDIIRKSPQPSPPGGPLHTLLLLGALTDKYGKQRVVVHTGKESLVKQLSMFVQARVVVGAHGAGLSNTLVCRPNTAVVMMPMKPMVDMTFVHLAAALNHKLFLATDVNSYYYGNYGTLSAKQIEQVMEATEAALAWTTERWQKEVLHDEL